MLRGRPSGLKAAAHRCGGGLRPALTPEPLRPLGGRNQGPGQGLPPAPRDTLTPPATS